MPESPCAVSVPFPQLVCQEPRQRYAWRCDDTASQILQRQRHQRLINLCRFPGRHTCTEVCQHAGLEQSEILKFGVITEKTLKLRDD